MAGINLYMLIVLLGDIQFDQLGIWMHVLMSNKCIQTIRTTQLKKLTKINIMEDKNMNSGVDCNF